MHFTCRSFIGKPTDNFWSQYWENEPNQKKNHHLFGLVSLSSTTTADLKTTGRQIIKDLNQHYFQPATPPDPLAHLKQILTTLTDQPQYQNLDLTLFVAIIFNQHLFLATYNSGHVILVRHSTISPLLSGQAQALNTIQGPLKDSDKIFLFTDQFQQSLSLSQIKTNLIQPDLNSIEENFLSSLNSLSDQSQLAAALIQVHLDQDPVDPAPPPPVSTPPTSYQEIITVKKTKKTNLFIAFLLLLALTASVYLGYQKNLAAATEKQYQGLKQELNQKLNDALAVKNLNLDSALDLANQSQQTLQKMRQLQIHSQEVDNYSSQIQDLLSQTGGSDSLAFDSFFDTSLIADNLDFTMLTLDGGSLFLLDSTTGRIDALSIEQKNTQNIGINDDIKNAVSFATVNNQVYFVTQKQIFLLQKQQLISQFSLTDQKVIDLAAWANNLYLLSSNSILKFSTTTSPLADPVTWLQDDQTLPNSPSSLAVNGKVWVLSKAGQLTPYLSGLKDNFKFSDKTQFNSTAHLALTQDTDLVAFSEDNHLVYVYQKDGQVHSRYNFGDLKVYDLVLHQDSSRLFVLASDQKVYQINLNL